MIKVPIQFPKDGLGNIELPERLRPESQDVACILIKRSMDLKEMNLNEKEMKAMADTEANMIKQEGKAIPAWAYGPVEDRSDARKQDSSVEGEILHHVSVG